MACNAIVAARNKALATSAHLQQNSLPSDTPATLYPSGSSHGASLMSTSTTPSSSTSPEQLGLGEEGNEQWESAGQEFDQMWPDAAFDLLSKLLCFDPSKRITAEQALSHEFFETSQNHSSSALSVPVATEQLDSFAQPPQVSHAVSSEHDPDPSSSSALSDYELDNTNE